MIQPSDPQQNTHANGEISVWLLQHRSVLLLVLLLLLELVSFYQLVTRDLANIYPFSFDQAAYLNDAYQSFEEMRNHGILAGLRNAWFTPGRPTGVLLQGEAALAFIFLGAGRTASLLVLFAHFALLQIILFAAFRRLSSGRSAPGLIAISLLLLSVSRYFSSGGLSDFRLDFPASCLYGISLAAFLCSDQFRDRRWSSIFGAALFALVATRFVAASYTGIAIVVSLAISRIANGRLSPQPGLFRRALLVCSVSAFAIFVFVLANARQLFEYYFYGHVVGPEKAIRAAEFGVADRMSALLFYPKSLANDHLGLAFLVFAGLLSILAIALREVPSESPSRESAMTPALRFAVAIVWLAAPLALFSLDEAKSPVVASVMVVPCVVLIVLLYLSLSGSSPGSIASPKLSRVQRWTASVLIFVAVIFNLSQNTIRRQQLKIAKDATELYATVDEIAAGIQRNNLAQPKFATDFTHDYFSGRAVKVMIYERTGKLVDTVETLANSLMAIPKEAALDAVRKSDYALITVSHPSTDNSPIYPFQKAMVAYRAELQAAASAQMIPVRRLSVADHVFQLFQRPNVEIIGSSGGWLPDSGSSIQLRLNELRRFPHIILSGSTLLSRELKDGLQCDAFLNGSRLPVKTNLGNDEFTIAIDATSALSSSSETVDISLRFPTYFVPSERGINSDTRKLAISVPQVKRLVEGPQSYPPTLRPPTAP